MAEEKGKDEKAAAPTRQTAGKAAAEKLREVVVILEASSGMRAKSHDQLARVLKQHIAWLESLE